MKPQARFLTAALLSFPALLPAQESWKPAPAPLMTKWAAEVSPENVWPEYPRPQLVRDNWQNLNGLWDYALVKIPGLPIQDAPEDKKKAEWTPRISLASALPLLRKMTPPSEWSGKTLVPFPLGSALSGVARLPEPDEAMWFRYPLKIAKRLPGHRVLLNFEGVDWFATVWVNGKQVAEHSGGHVPFSADITDALVGKDSAEIVVRAWDPTNFGPQPRGKQHLNPQGYWYTRVSGIWQTVWLEQVPAVHVTGVLAEANAGLDGLDVTVNVSGGQAEPVELVFDNGDGETRAWGNSGSPIHVKIPDPRLWSPENPALYDFTVRIPGETVSSYAGIRRFEKKADEKGIPRILLNGKPIYLCGTLDQGWWPDGLYLAPTDAALRYDVEMTKKLGFNMIRKHIKVEPRRWYRHCDESGIVVWQDMPSGTCSNPEGRPIHAEESLAIVDLLRGHPSIAMWIAFNEGWGQDPDREETRTAELTAAIKALDPSRLVSDASGWHDRHAGDVRDIHAYPDPQMPRVEKERVAVLGEFGGLGLPIPDHTWSKKGWGYQNLTDSGDLLRRYEEMSTVLRDYACKGLCASVYTQITDVELENNGLITYDRAVIKLPVGKVAELNRGLIAGHTPPHRTTITDSEPQP